MKYLIRAAKYAVKLVVLLAVIFWLIRTSDTSYFAMAGEGFWATFLGSTRGKIFLVLVCAWVVLYPAVEYVKRGLFFSMGKHRGAIVRAMEAGGYELLKETEDEMVFCAKGTLRRVLWLGEERVTITSSTDGGIEIEGPRRFTAEAVQRIPMYVENEKD